jgi:hypothetical protein
MEKEDKEILDKMIRETRNLAQKQLEAQKAFHSKLKIYDEESVETLREIDINLRQIKDGFGLSSANAALVKAMLDKSERALFLSLTNIQITIGELSKTLQSIADGSERLDD